jgi:hypothetical protein
MDGSGAHMHGMGAMPPTTVTIVDDSDYNPHAGMQVVEYERTGPVYMRERPIRGTKMLSDWDPDTKYLDLVASRQAAWHGQRRDARDSPHASMRLATGHHMPAPHGVGQSRRPHQGIRPTSSPGRRFSPRRDYSFAFLDSAGIDFLAADGPEVSLQSLRICFLLLQQGQPGRWRLQCVAFQRT